MTTRWARLVRGLLTAALATFVAALFHVASGGPAPSLLAVVLTMAFAVMLCTFLTGRRVALWRQSVAVAASQFLFHTLFVLGQGRAALAPGSDAEHLHAGMTIAFATGDPASASLAHSGHVMWLGHTLAAVVTVAALRHGESALRGLATVTTVRVTRLLRLAPEPSMSGCVPAAFPKVAAFPTPDILLASLRHRGPPVA